MYILPDFKQCLCHKHVEKLGIENVKPILLSEVLEHIIADENEKWDAVLLVEYPSAEVLKTIGLSKEYSELAGPIREAALSEWKLYLTRKLVM